MSLVNANISKIWLRPISLNNASRGRFITIARLREGTLKVRGFQKVSFTKTNKMLSTKLPLMYNQGQFCGQFFVHFLENTLQKLYFEIF